METIFYLCRLPYLHGLWRENRKTKWCLPQSGTDLKHPSSKLPFACVRGFPSHLGITSTSGGTEPAGSGATRVARGILGLLNLFFCRRERTLLCSNATSQEWVAFHFKRHTGYYSASWSAEGLVDKKFFLGAPFYRREQVKVTRRCTGRS